MLIQNEMTRLYILILVFFIHNAAMSQKIRGLADTVGFAHSPRQMDSLMARISEAYGEKYLKKDQPRIPGESSWKLAISPHDDHTYVGNLYPALLKDVRTKTVILFGVAHRAKT